MQTYNSELTVSFNNEWIILVVNAAHVVRWHGLAADHNLPILDE